MDEVKGAATLLVRALPLLFWFEAEVFLNCILRSGIPEVTRATSGSRRNYHSVLEGLGDGEGSLFGFWRRKVAGGGGGGDVRVVFA